MEERSFVATVYSLLLLFGRTWGFVETTMPNDYMICRPVSGIFGELAGGNSTADKGLLPSMQGAEGPPGRHGRTGLPGPRGEPNYEKMTSIIQDKIHPVNARIFQLEREIAELKASGAVGGGGYDYVATTQSPEDVKYGKECMDRFKAPIQMGPMCYSIIGGEGLQWSFDLAESNCTKLGGYPADLNSRALYDKIYHYVDRTYSKVVQAWTGMRYESDKLLKTDGKAPTFAKWMAYNPRKSRSSYSSYYKTYTYVYSNIDTSSRVNGLQNSPPTRKLSYAICHFSVGNENVTRRSTTPQTTTTQSADWDTDYYYDD